MEKVEDRWVTGLLKLALVILYIENDMLDEAQQMAEETEKIFQEVKDAYCLMVTYFWSMAIAMKINDVKLYDQSKAVFESLMNEHAFHFFTSKVTLFGPRDLVEKQKVLNFTIEHYKPTICIKLFGPVLFVRNWKVETEKVWQREKAKELFVYLYIHRNRFCSKEEIMDALFPSSTEDVAVRDFKVAYNALLKVLEPERNAREESFYIERKTGMYRIRSAPYIESDVHYFEQLISLANKQHCPILRKQWLLKAIQQYTGNLYEENSHIEWLHQERQRYKTLYLKAVEQLAQLLFEAQHYEQSIQYCEIILSKEPTWEEAYRLTMWCYFYLENKVAVQKTYERCEQVLLQQYDMEPMQSTTEIFEKLIKI